MSDADDALAIANLKARYARTADLAAEDEAAARVQFAALLTDDFVGEYGPPTMHGPAAAIDFLCNAIAGGSDWMIHSLHSPCIAISGDRATGAWTVQAQSRRRGTGEISTVLGRYTDTFRRTPDGWRIASIGFWRPA